MIIELSYNTSTGMLFSTFEVIERPIVCFSFHSRITERIRFATSDDLMLLRIK